MSRYNFDLGYDLKGVRSPVIGDTEKSELRDDSKGSGFTHRPYGVKTDGSQTRVLTTLRSGRVIPMVEVRSSW